MTVLAVVCALCAKTTVHEDATLVAMKSEHTVIHFEEVMRAHDRRPNGSEIARRMILWFPPAFAATLAVMWTIRRLKSRRHTEPPVG